MTQLSTVLDPRYKLQIFQTLNWSQSDVRHIEISLKESYEYNKRVYKLDENTEKSSKILKRQLSDSIAGFSEFLSNHCEDSQSKDEIQRYLQSARVPQNTCPLDWWKTFAKDFPILSFMAKIFLGAPASSVPCEELFSGAVDLVTPDRCSLSPESISQVMLLKNWHRNNHQ